MAALTPADGGRRRLPPGGSEAIDPTTAAAESVILGPADGPRRARSAAATSRRSPTRSAGRWPPSSLDVTADDRVVLTTRGRLLRNELFGRLV